MECGDVLMLLLHCPWVMAFVDYQAWTAATCASPGTATALRPVVLYNACSAGSERSCGDLVWWTGGDICSPNAFEPYLVDMMLAVQLCTGPSQNLQRSQHAAQGSSHVMPP